MDQGRVTQVRAADVGEGCRIVQPDGTATAPVMAVDWSSGWAAVVLDDGDHLDFPMDAVLSAIWHEDATDVPLSRPRVVGDDADPRVALMRSIVDEHPGDPAVERLAARVARGIRTPSGRRVSPSCTCGWMIHATRSRCARSSPASASTTTSTCAPGSARRSA